MQFINSVIDAIATPVRQIYYWISRLVPGLKTLGKASLPMQMALGTLVFLLIIWFAFAVRQYLKGFLSLWDSLLTNLILTGLVIVIPVIVYYFTKSLMIREESRYPEIDKIWYDALEDMERQGIDLTDVPLFIVLGATTGKFGVQLLKISEMGLDVVVPKQSEGDIAIAGNSEAVFLFLHGCSCMSRLSAQSASTTESQKQTAPAVGLMNDASHTIDPSFFDRGPIIASPPSSPDNWSAHANDTLLLPEDQDFSDVIGTLTKPQRTMRSKQISANDIADCENRLRHVCELVKKSRQQFCPINGVLSAIPFETIESSSAQLQIAAQKDLALLREQLMVRCVCTVLVTHMENEEGFLELINRFGPQKSKEFRFGKGFKKGEVWCLPDSERLHAVGIHAAGAFEDWIYILFQDEASLKRRYNSKLFTLMCKMRGAFSSYLATSLANGFGVDLNTDPDLAYEQFLFGGCYFAATGTDPNEQAFVRSVLAKLVEQDGELEWNPKARALEQQYQFVANVAVLIGTVALVSVLAMLGIWYYNTEA